MLSRRSRFVPMVILSGGIAWALIDAPVAVSPGAREGVGIAIADRCPTFSWSQTEGANAYELKVYRLGGSGTEVREILTERIPAGALSWTPSLARCLEPGASYGWSVRADLGGEHTEWSEPSLFEVVGEPAERARTRPGTYHVEAASDSAGDSGAAAVETATTPSRTPSLPPGGDGLLAPSPGTQLSVDGNVDALSFSGDGALLTGLDPANLSPGTAGIDITGNAATSSSADRVDGFDASAVAAANTLLALDGSAMLPADITGNAATASAAATAAALVSNGSNCAADEAAGGVDAAGNAEDCRDQADLTAFGTHNTRVGSLALVSNTTGSNNTATGLRALEYNTIGYLNTAIGSAALRNNTTGDRNVALGYGAGFDATTGSDNIFIANTGVAGDDKTIKIGTQGTQTATYLAGIHGTSLSGSAVVVTATGQLGVASGTPGDADTLDGIDSTEFLQKTELDTEAELEAVVGAGLISATETAFAATSLAADGANCQAGEWAAGVDESGNAQGCTPDAAGIDHGFGTGNTRVGSLALTSNTIGEDNSAHGYRALQANITGSYNTAMGKGALSSNTAGVNNTAIGRDALLGTTGNWNTAIGSNSLRLNTAGERNTATGNAALANTTGSRNIAVGDFAGSVNTTGSNSIWIGTQGATESNTLRIGSGTGTENWQQNRAFISGIRGITTGVTDAIPVLIDSAGQLGTVSSSLRYKEDVADLGEASERLLELRPVTFRYQKEFADGGKPSQYGLIAEEVAEVFPELVVYDAEGRPETVKYHLLSVLLLNELQKLHARSEARDGELAALQSPGENSAELAVLRREVGELKAETAELRQVDERLRRLEALWAADRQRAVLDVGRPVAGGPDQERPAAGVLGVPAWLRRPSLEQP